MFKKINNKNISCALAPYLKNKDNFRIIDIKIYCFSIIENITIKIKMRYNNLYFKN